MVDNENLAALALDAVSSSGASYADVRVSSLKQEEIHTRESKVKNLSFTVSAGIGIRVLCDGAWGFAATSTLDRDSVQRAALDAVRTAKALRHLHRDSIRLTPLEAFHGTWSSSIVKDPFTLSSREKTEQLISYNHLAQQHGAHYCDSFMFCIHEHKYFASSLGSSITQDFFRTWAQATATVIDSRLGRFETRATFTPPLACGYEYFDRVRMEQEILKAVEGAKQKLVAPSVTPGKKTLILDPTNLWLTIHETCGHATELDRALGYEANYAGTSFLTPDKLGTFKYGSDLVNLIGNRNEPLGLASCGYDDEGVPAACFPIIQNGLFVNYQTTREHSSAPALNGSCGCAFADSWSHVPMQRMPNISLQPGTARCSLSDLISDTEDGILIYGDGSWSIDQQRYNFQFTGQEFWEIKQGKLVGMLRDVAYQGNTQQFWSSLDALCDDREYELGGSLYCGKGQPTQVAPVSHGAVPARFREINVLNVA